MNRRPYSPLETFTEDACCRFDHIAVCYCRVRPGFRTCCDRTGSHRSGYDAGACTQDDEARAQGESPRDAQEGGVIIHGPGVKYQNPASAGFFRIERLVLNSVIVRRLTSSRCSRQSRARLDWSHSDNAALCEREHLVAKAFAAGPWAGPSGWASGRLSTQNPAKTLPYASASALALHVLRRASNARPVQIAIVKFARRKASRPQH